jgi:hypothetical protein
MSRRLALIGAFIIVAAVGIGAGYALRGGDAKKAATTASSASASSSSASSSSSSAPPTSVGPTPATLAPPTTLSTAGLDGPAAELATAINKASGLTYHAVYKGTTTGKSGTASEQTVEIWRQLPLARRDTTLVSPKGSFHTEEYRLVDKIVGCVDTAMAGAGTSKFTCLPAEGKGVDPADPLIGTARPVNGAVTVRDDTIGSLTVRCFSVRATSGAVQEACFDGDGIPASIDGGDGRLVRVEVGRGVDPAVIQVPQGAQQINPGSSGSPGSSASTPGA